MKQLFLNSFKLKFCYNAVLKDYNFLIKPKFSKWVSLSEKLEDTDPIKALYDCFISR